MRHPQQTFRGERPTDFKKGIATIQSGLHTQKKQMLQIQMKSMIDVLRTTELSATDRQTL